MTMMANSFLIFTAYNDVNILNFIFIHETGGSGLSGRPGRVGIGGDPGEPGIPGDKGKTETNV